MKKELCKNCVFYTAYYKQLSSCYCKLNNGFCTKHQKSQTRLETCTDFKSNERKEEMWAEIRLSSLEQALISIHQIAQILKEKENEKREV